VSKPRVGVLYSRVRVEEKLLFEAFERRGIALDLLDDQKLIFDLTNVDEHPYRHYDVIVERCINHSRALYSLKILNDQGVKTVKESLTKVGDEGLKAMWSAKAGGATLMSMPKTALVRAIVMNHWIHHRGQLSVYLRLLDIPVPPIYGPSADENPFTAA